MKKRLYIETTVVSYFTARPSRDLIVAGHQEATHELWPKLSGEYESYISALVYEEAGRGDPLAAGKRLDALKPFAMLAVDDEARILAEKIVAGRGIPEEYPEDALHVAVAAVNGIEVIITWNFAHLPTLLPALWSDRLLKMRATSALKYVRLRNYWREANERPHCRRSAKAPDGAYNQI